MASLFKRSTAGPPPAAIDERADLLERQKAAENEPAWIEAAVLLEETLLVWRLEDGKPVKVKPIDQGVFFDDEVYIVLKSSNKRGKLCFDVHYWVGLKNLEKFGFAPPKKLYELISLFDDKAIIHREIEYFESDLFISYFPCFGVFRNGLQSAFDREKLKDYKPRLLHFKLIGKKVEFREVPCSKKALDKGDVFILDRGVFLTQWNGANCDKEERIRARKYVESLVKNRQGKLQVEFYDEEDLLPVNDFTNQLSDEEVPQRPKKVSFPKSMHRLSDESGQLKLTTVYSGKALRAGINPEDVTFIDTATGLFVYIGPTASPKERASAWSEANKYLKTTNHPHTPLILLRAGETSFELNDVWDDGLD